MRRLVAAALGLAGCYDPALAPWDGGGGTSDATAPAGDGAEADGAPDGGLLEIDARVVVGCPVTTSGCTAFTCGATVSCYQWCPPHKTLWSDANDECIAWGGAQTATLVAIGSQAENDCVFEQIRENADPTWWYGYWIGYVQAAGGAEPGGGWGWVDGSGTSYVNWYTGSYPQHDGDEPDDDTGNDDCAFMFREEDLGGGWADTFCSQNPDFTLVGSVCEAHR